MKIGIVGASGFVGRRLVEQLVEATEWDLAVFSRSPEHARAFLPNGVASHRWEPESGPPPEQSLQDVDAIINLSGENVAARRWSKRQMKKLRDSRIIGTRNLVLGLAALRKRQPGKGSVLINASAIGYYGPHGDEELDEGARPGGDFLSTLCSDWETEALRARDLGVRVALERIGIVLGAGGGALAKMLAPFKLGLGGPIASGRQWMSWIHLDDLCSMILHTVKNDAISGPINGTGPRPVTNREFTRTLGKVLGRPAFMPMPGILLRVLVGDFAQVLVSGQKVLPRKALDTGFKFQHPELEGALRSILVGAKG